MTATLPTGAYLVDWVLNGSQITPDDLRIAMAAHGFDASVVPNINQTTAVKRIARSWRITSSGYASAVVKAAETADELVISVRHKQEGQRQADALHVVELVWDKVNSQWMPWTCAPEHAAAVRQLIAKCDRERTHLDCDWIRPTLIQAPLKKMGSVSFIRRTGGAQLVAAVHAPEVRRICALVNSIGDCFMGMGKQDLADADTARTVQRSVEQGLAERINSARGQLQEWRERGTRLQTGAIGARLGEYKAIKAQADLYARSLQITMDDLVADIDAATAEARTLLDIAMGRHPDPRIGDGSAMDVPAEAAADAPANVAVCM